MIKNPLINFNGAQSVPTILPPYYRGSAKSSLIDMLRLGHADTELTKEEIDKVSAWIDLYIPYSGDYYEENTWSNQEKEYYKYYEDKAKASSKEEANSIREYIESKKN